MPSGTIPHSTPIISATIVDTSVHGRFRRASHSIVVVVIAVLAFAQAAIALQFEPTEFEWASWPEYCRARYMESAAGRESQFLGRVDAGLVANWRARLGAAWDPLHHYCAGLVITDRARIEPDKRQRENLLRRVIEENRYALARIPPSHPMYAEIAARSGLVHRDLGEDDLALRHLEMAIKECPKCVVGYQAMAIFHRGKGQLAEARRTLESGDQVTDGKSVEINYFLGLVLLDLKEFPAAQAHARKAYDMGYPLPGLRDQLARAGHPLD